MYHSDSQGPGLLQSQPLSPYLTDTRDQVHFSYSNGGDAYQHDLNGIYVNAHFTNGRSNDAEQMSPRAVGSERRRKPSSDDIRYAWREHKSVGKIYEYPSQFFATNHEDTELADQLRKTSLSNENCQRKDGRDQKHLVSCVHEKEVRALTPGRMPLWRDENSRNPNSERNRAASFTNAYPLADKKRQNFRRQVSFSGVSESRESELIMKRKTSAEEQRSQTHTRSTMLRNSYSAPSLSKHFQGFQQQNNQGNTEINAGRSPAENILSGSLRGSYAINIRRSSRTSVTLQDSVLLEEERHLGLNNNPNTRLNPKLTQTVLKSPFGNTPPKDVSNHVGLKARTGVHAPLFAVDREEGMSYHTGKPQMWSPADRRSPGVIGSERRTAHLRSKSLNERLLSEKYYPNKYEKQVAALKPRSKSFNTYGDSERGVESCNLCKIVFSSKQQAEEHAQSTKHRNKIAKLTSEPYQKFCEHCKVHLNSKSQAEEHFSSARHEHTVTKLQKASRRRHPPLKTQPDDCTDSVSTKTSPNRYHLELVTKAMAMNTVCYLPTGTGKTLVSAFLMANVLHLNPTRQVVFLVDRVLLVLQQSDFLRDELQNVRIPVLGESKSQGSSGSYGMMDWRPVRVGAICGEMRKLEPGVPIFEHDVLVVTADCYRNHLNNGTLRFEDLALLVLDEAHHCNKEHPYNVIIRDHFLRDSIRSSQAPRLLGLISSLAGEMTTEKTIKKLQRLISNLGGATLLTVTEELQDLADNMKLGKLNCYVARYTEQEQELLAICIEYATKCFNHVARLSELKDYKDIFQPSAGGLLDTNDVYPILKIIDNILQSPKSDEHGVNALLHFKVICESICSLQECGEGVACHQIMELERMGCCYGFAWAVDQGLPCEKVKLMMFRSMQEVFGSGISELIHLLLNCDWGTLEGDDVPVAVVLIKRHSTAALLASYLENCVELQDLGVSVTQEGASDFKDLQTIPKSSFLQGPFLVAVTTSLASKHLNLPNCKLVIQMDPLNSVSALNEIRECGSQRKAEYAIISRDEDMGKKVKDLLQREENMGQAARVIGDAGY